MNLLKILTTVYNNFLFVYSYENSQFKKVNPQDTLSSISITNLNICRS
jgi:hypothetical protein